ncbi:hypothetical protein AB0A69_09685 [Streptomyces sp. NPDC045431]|uniref:hypothetical protein n=1 Tax=Streptomyces sp. NPDC045431 TaxID=3155613 RepID=UPI0033C6AB4F
MPFGLVLCLVTACSVGSGEDDGPRAGAPKPGAGGTKTATPTTKSYDPPLKFESSATYPVAGGYNEGNWAVRLDGTTVYAASDNEVKAVDALSGKALWSVQPQGRASEDDDYGTGDVAGPTLVQLDGKPTVLAAFAVTVPGSGTTPERPVIELTAVAADSGKRLWTATIDRPEGQEDGDPVLVGSDGTTAVVRLGVESEAATLGITLATRQTSWTAKGFYAGFIDGGTVVGRGGADSALGGGASVEGLRIADGKRTWTYMDRLNRTVLRPVGAGLFTAEVDAPFVRDQDISALLEVSTGKPPAGVDAKALDALLDLSCEHDERATIVCQAEEGWDRRVFALDAQSFKELWAIDESDETRLTPEIGTAWHGAVYASTDNGPVILDARTGKDKATDPGLRPFQVNGHAGLYSGGATKGISVSRAIG